MMINCGLCYATYFCYLFDAVISAQSFWITFSNLVTCKSMVFIFVVAFFFSIEINTQGVTWSRGNLFKLPIPKSTAHVKFSFPWLRQQIKYTGCARGRWCFDLIGALPLLVTKGLFIDLSGWESLKYYSAHSRHGKLPMEHDFYQFLVLIKRWM